MNMGLNETHRNTDVTIQNAPAPWSIKLQDQL